MADLLWDVPQTNSAVLCCRQKHISGRMGAQAPDGSVHVSVHQDVACCILLSYFDDLCVPCPNEDFTLTQPWEKSVKVQMRWGEQTFERVSNLPFLCIQSEHSLWSVQSLIETLCSASVPGPTASERHPPLTWREKEKRKKLIALINMYVFPTRIYLVSFLAATSSSIGRSVVGPQKYATFWRPQFLP